MMPDLPDDPEREVLSTEEARDLAEKSVGQADAVRSGGKKIPPSLLAAEHIEQYVMATGLISPFHLGGGRHSRLKKAAYEGRIGNKAFQYNEDNQLVKVQFENGMLNVPHNSIVFVECNLEFRLPEYIALRFNLQIRHVHRGLLLGTGPLVDPGYWGKLCIPLHNLTDEDYSIPLDEGLIWIEFTRTTSDLGTRAPRGRKPLDREFWNIEDFIEKAATPFDGRSPKVAIRSSIPHMVQSADEQSSKALEQAQKAEQESLAARNRVTELDQRLNRIAWLGAVVAGITVAALWATFVAAIIGYYLALNPRIDAAQSDISELKVVSSEGADAAQAVNALASELAQFRAQLERLSTERDQLAIELREMKSRQELSDSVEQEPSTAMPVTEAPSKAQVPNPPLPDAAPVTTR